MEPTSNRMKAKPWPDGFNCNRDCNDGEKCKDDGALRNKCSKMCPVRYPQKKFDPICVQEPKVKEKIKIKEPDDEISLSNYKKNEKYFNAIQYVLDLFEVNIQNIKEKNKNIEELISTIEELIFNNKLPNNEITEKVIGMNDYWREFVLKILINMQKSETHNLHDIESIKVMIETLQGLLIHKNGLPPDIGLSTYILDQYKEIIPHDPPFFKLTLKNDRTIYILGSLHPRNPQVLLSKRVFEKILEIAPHATLCTEHKSYFNYYIDKIEKILKEKPDIKNEWNMDEYFDAGKIKYPKGRKNKWNIIKNDSINNSNLKIIDIQKLPPNEGRILFKSIVEKMVSKKDKKYIPGFEPSLRKLPWKNKNTIYLETVDEWATATAIYDSDITALFNESFAKLMGYFIAEQKQYSEKEKLTISIEDHKNSNESYGFDTLSKKKIIKKSVVERNKIWVNNILYYLEENTNENLLFIVCGIEHLRNENSFIIKIAERLKDDIISIERINNEGVLIPVKLLDK
jgi:hypothetical protein